MLTPRFLVIAEYLQFGTSMTICPQFPRCGSYLQPAKLLGGLQLSVEEVGRRMSNRTSHRARQVNVALSICGGLIVLKAVPAFSNLFLAAGSIHWLYVQKAYFL